jgi:hypothetical protein
VGCRLVAGALPLPVRLLYLFDGSLAISRFLWRLRIWGGRWLAFYAWIGHFRRLARDFERYARTVEAFICLPMIRITLRRLTRSNSCSLNPNFLDRLLD